MDTLLQLLDRGLQGDADALTFLERTASIYIFDGTNPRQPKTFGIWDFLNQALTEVERVESRLMQSATRVSTLVNHVQLIATIAKRAAHKTYNADRTHIQICLQNAAQYHGSPDQARMLIEANTEMRQRVMGRIAAIVFDFSYHLVTLPNPHRFHSAFSHPIAVESLCALIAANAVSSSPTEVINLVSELIIPGVQYLLMEDGRQQQTHLSMPPFSAVALLYHIALEAKGKTAPAGTRHILKTQLFSPVLAKVLGPILVEAIRDSDMGKDRDEGNHGNSTAYTPGSFAFTSWISSSYKITAMSFRALEVWISITDARITQVILALEESGISFVEVISEAMYSDSASVLESIASLLQVLFRQESPESRTKPVPTYDDDLQYREHLLSEIVTAIGLQTNHFIEAQRQGSLGVCHSISNIASTTATALSPFLRAGKLSIDRCSSFIEVLALCASHRLLHICSIAITAFSSLTKLSSTLAKRILQILQSRAIIPPNLVGFSSPLASYDVDLEEFELFRENVLKDVLQSCYTTSRSYYIESCVTAVEEFCTTSALSKQKKINPQLSFQLEAALFCLCTVAEDACKRALLHGASPAVIAIATKASESSRVVDGIPLDIALDAEKHDEQLTRCLHAVVEFPVLAFSNQYVLGQMCRFLHSYSSWISNTSAPGVLDVAANLAINAFNHQATHRADKDNAIMSEHVSPFSEASLALRSILKRTPQRFTTPEALATLEESWRKLYDMTTDVSCGVSVEDRKVFCSGICSVLKLLQPNDCNQAIVGLSEPALHTIDMILKDEEHMKQARPSSTSSSPYFTRVSEEIQILSTILKSFHGHTFSSDMNESDFSTVESKGRDHPLRKLLQLAWPSLCHIAMNYSWNDRIASSLFELLQVAASMNPSGIASSNFLSDLNGLASIILEKASSELHANTVISSIEYAACVADVYGPNADREESMNESLSSVTKTGISTDLETSLYLAVNASKFISSQTQAPDITSCILKLCSMYIKSCPKILLNLPVVAGEQGKDGQLLAQIIERALMGVTEKEVDVARQSMLFLRDLVQNCVLLNQEESSPKDENIIRSSLEPLMDEIRTELINSLLHGACGIFPQDVLDPAANLFLIVLRTAPTIDDLKIRLSQSLHPEYFLLGDEAKLTILKRILHCIEGKDMSFVSPSIIMDLFTDVWRLHQIEDKDVSLAGSDDVLEFIQKYT